LKSIDGGSAPLHGRFEGRARRRDKGIVLTRTIVAFALIKGGGRSDNDIIVSFVGKLALVGGEGVERRIHVLYYFILSIDFIGF
jgi:hypothetical protein